MHCDFCFLPTPTDEELSPDRERWTYIITKPFEVEVVDPVSRVITIVSMSPEWLACPTCRDLFAKRAYEQILNRCRVNDPAWTEAAREGILQLWKKIVENIPQ